MDEIASACKRSHRLAILFHEFHLIVTRGDDRLVGETDEVDRGDLLAEPLNVLLALPGCEIPNLYDVVGASAGQRAPVTLPTDAHGVVGMAFKGFYNFA